LVSQLLKNDVDGRDDDGEKTVIEEKPGRIEDFGSTAAARRGGTRDEHGS